MIQHVHSDRTPDLEFNLITWKGRVMRRARSSTTLFLSALLAMAIAFVTAAPANAAPKRSNGRSAVIFVHGFDGTGAAATNCQEY